MPLLQNVLVASVPVVPRPDAQRQHRAAGALQQRLPPPPGRCVLRAGHDRVLSFVESDGATVRGGAAADRVWMVRRSEPPAFEPYYAVWPGETSDSTYAVTIDPAVPMTARRTAVSSRLRAVASIPPMSATSGPYSCRSFEYSISALMMLLIQRQLMPASMTIGRRELRSPPVVHMTRRETPCFRRRSLTFR